MFIREDLVYDKSNDKLIGFTDLGDISKHLVAHEKCLNEDTCPYFYGLQFIHSNEIPMHAVFYATVSGDLLFAPI